MSKDRTGVLGIRVIGIASALLVLLKLTHVLDWQWVWVMSPLWIVAAMAIPSAWRD